MFCDDGSDVSFISQGAAQRLQARTLEGGFLEMSTLHGTKSIPTTRGLLYGGSRRSYIKVAPHHPDYESAKIIEIGLFLSSNAPFFDSKFKIWGKNG